MNRPNTRAFTLIELLTVIAIIGILASIIIPTVGSVKTAAKKAQTKTQFSQWATALNLFKQEYGYYPTDVVNGNKIKKEYFIATLSGQKYNGNKYEPGDDEVSGNKKLISFYSFSDNDILDPNATSDREVKDAFGNTDIAIFFDTNGDGVINNNDIPAFTTAKVTGKKTTNSLEPDFTPADGVRSGVVFYSAGKGDTPKDIVYSWK